ncbi:MAG: acyl-CoA dehydrogenase, partial [Gammaproteobacteria bacterium]
ADGGFAEPSLVDFDRDGDLDVLIMEGHESRVVFQEGPGRFASEAIAPTNRVGDQVGSKLEDGVVTTADGFADVYGQFVENGWNSLEHNPEFGGQGMPKLVGAAAYELWHGANMAMALCPTLTSGAIDAIETHGSEELQSIYLEKLVSGEWTGTMNLTEPGAGSDLSAVRSKAVPDGDHYRISGQKIFITWGEHDAAENIIHLVLARLPDAPEGTRGISLFLVPKFLVNADGSLGERNDLVASAVEHKLGIHGSPTCVMSFGDNDGAIGYLVGQENKGLACMFTMMNAARLAMGTQGVAVSERAYQAAASYAKERIQGGAHGHEGKVAIIEHPDVRRMLLLMRSQTEAGRALVLTAMAAMDRANQAKDDAERAAQQARVDLLTPIVKAWATENAQEITSLGVQIHGGMGYVEETGAAQFYRDARITTIYEGTTGIQALDLIGRKTLRDGGEAAKAMLAEMEQAGEALAASDKLGDMSPAYMACIGQARDALDWVLEQGPSDPNIPASAAVPYLMLMGTACGAWMMVRAALAAQADMDNGDNAPYLAGKVLTTRFYLDQVAPRAAGLLTTVRGGVGVITAADTEWF